MVYSDNIDNEGKQRIVQELVPGRQITLAHLIANPDRELYEKIGLKSQGGNRMPAIGVLTVSPAETAIIFADIAMKAAGVKLEYVDRIRGSLIITGTVSEAEASMQAVMNYADEELNYAVCRITKS